MTERRNDEPRTKQTESKFVTKSEKQDGIQCISDDIYELLHSESNRDADAALTHLTHTCSF